MRRIGIAVAAFGVLASGAAVPAAAQSAPADTTQRAQVSSDSTAAGCGNVTRNTGYVHSWSGANCTGVHGYTKKSDKSWSKKRNNKATSLVNAGQKGGATVVRFYDKKNYSDPSRCLKRGDSLSNLQKEKYDNGKNMNNSISSHQWLYSCK